MSKLVCGVGINDRTGARSTEYLLWRNMLKRCYDLKAKAAMPTYAGCTVSAEWLVFSCFQTWAQQQPKESKSLDKDLLFPGNKLYSSETCVFVPEGLNNFLLDCSASRGPYPLGVVWHKVANKYRARCRDPFTKTYEHLGYFTCPQEAHLAWKARKHQHALVYASQQTDVRIANALRTRYV